MPAPGVLGREARSVGGALERSIGLGVVAAALWEVGLETALRVRGERKGAACKRLGLGMPGGSQLSAVVAAAFFVHVRVGLYEGQHKRVRWTKVQRERESRGMFVGQWGRDELCW